MKKLLAAFIVLGLVLGGLWLGGFLIFIQNITFWQTPGVLDDAKEAEAIVVLTGGSERLATGLSLLEAHKGKKLFISGVHENLSLDEVLRSLSLSPELKACCVTLGYEATSTHTNAQETRVWMESQGMTSMRLVTSNYHMPRSLLLFHAAMPDMTIIPTPVAPDKVKLRTWWEHPGTANLLITEYSKFLVAVICLRLGI
ncbi:MAG: YdcF family protein [Alphaproteobacteria bacterium]|nr:YdcF family protein [Alphaproteobacteria bacterium]